MNKKVAIVDYGMGNLHSLFRVFTRLQIQAIISCDPKEISEASHVVLPGVGHFDYAMNKFNESGMVESVTDLVMSKSVPVLGICVGMQMLATYSEEGKLPGLNWINADVKKIDSSLLTQTTRLPHMGWNDISLINQSPLFEDIDTEIGFYFLHSFYFECELELFFLQSASNFIRINHPHFINSSHLLLLLQRRKSFVLQIPTPTLHVMALYCDIIKPLHSNSQLK